MLNPHYVLPIHGELGIDLFAGGGGASTGIEEAIGRHFVNWAANPWVGVVEFKLLTP